jgi:undecaprenyldiphospho-muramoylpentapeptide beta-N-acetylglucosaminyltransferase
VWALVSGGGTGGHVYPALALAEELVARGHDPTSIRFVGTTRGLEATAVPAAGFAVDLLPGRGWQRRPGVRACVQNLAALWTTVVATARALVLVRAVRPAVVVGVGGYASLPTVLAARLLRIPTVVHEQNAVPGVANRIAARLGARAAVSIPGTPLVGATLTGNPVRPAVATARRVPVDPPQVAVVGGSLGARRLNDAALGLYERWRGRDDVAIHHVSGRRDYEGCCARLAGLRGPGDALAYRLVPFEEHMEHVYEQAALLVCRAGAVTIAELAVVGVPSVLVPLPGAPGDHQTRNARALVAAGAAVLVPDAELDAERLAAELGPLLADPERRATMGERARSVGRPDAAARLADLVEEHSRVAR